MYRILTIEREYGSGAGEIAQTIAEQLGWKLWDHALTEEIAKRAQVDPSTVGRCEERMDSRFHRLAKAFWRGSYERSSSVLSQPVFDTDRMVGMIQEIMNRIGQEGNAVVVGRGAPYFLREHPNAFHVFLYAPRAEKIRRTIAEGHSEQETEELVDSVDRERAAYIKHYFNADWPTRSLYHVMLNTAVGNNSVVRTILNTMHTVDGGPRATDYDQSKVPSALR